MLLALCIPLLVLGLDKARTQVLVGHSQGNALLWVNLEIKTFFQLQRDELAMLERRGIIPMTPDPAYLSALPSSHGALRVPHSPTGIPLLDLESTPDGSMNAHAIEIVLIAEKHYKREALSLLQNVPAAYFRAVLSALTHDYFLSPFEAADSINRLKLEAFNGRVEKLLLPDRDGLPRLLVIALPMTLLYGIYRVFCARAVLESERSTVAAISCILVIVLYVTVATTLISCAEFSRYRFNVDPLYVVLFSLMATDFCRAAARWCAGRY